MDANGTRFHLLRGSADWPRWRMPGPDASGAPVPAQDSVGQVQFLPGSSEIALWPRAFRFPAGRGDRPVDLAQRRGAARDAFGNWYWIGEDNASIRVWSSGSGAVSLLWPLPTAPAAA